MNNGKKEKVKEAKEEYKIKDIFAKNSELSVNEIIKKSFLVNLRTSKLN